MTTIKNQRDTTMGTIRVIQYAARGWGFALLFGVWVCLQAAPWACAEPVVNEVRVEGLDLVRPETVLRVVKTRSGTVVDEKQIAEDAKRVLILPEIYDTQWRLEATDAISNGVNLIFTVKEAQRIESVELFGNKKYENKKLLPLLQFGEGDFIDRYLINHGAEQIQNYYHDKGYYFSTVAVNEEKLSSERRVIYIITEGPRLQIKKIDFEGNEHIRSGKLKSQVQSKTYFPIFSKGKLEDRQVEQDVQSVTRYYNDRGFLDAHVFARKEFNLERTKLFLTFVVDEGPRYKVGDIQFRGNELFEDDALWKECLDLKPGNFYRYSDVRKVEKNLTFAYGRQGYIYTRCETMKEFSNTPEQVNLIFDIDEGEPYHLGRVVITGNYKTQDKVVRRDFDRHGFLPGGLYNTEAVDKATTRLKGSGLFEDVSVTPFGDKPEERDALVEVSETNTGLLLFGVGVDTNSGVIGQISLEQRNFDLKRRPQSLKELFTGQGHVGAGQTLRLQFNPGTEVTSARINFHDPYLFDQPYYLDLNLFVFRRYRESYLEKRSGGSVTLGRRFDNDWSVDLTERTEFINVSDLDVGWRIPGDKTSGRTYIAPQDVIDVRGNNMINSLSPGISYDTTDSLYRPSKGFRLSFNYEEVIGALSDFNFGSFGSTLKTYQTLYEDITDRKVILSSRLEGRSIVHGDAPVFERYYAGGIGTIRGFEYRGVSPRDGRQRDPIGSDYIVLLGSELSYPLYEEILYGKFFCDTGTVSEGPYRVTLGFGFDVMIPQVFQMIPMSFNFGVPVYYDDEDDKQLFSFSLGLSF